MKHHQISLELALMILMVTVECFVLYDDPSSLLSASVYEKPSSLILVIVECSVKKLLPVMERKDRSAELHLGRNSP